jgi:hypothetical protein
MCALGQKRTNTVQKDMSALPPKADMCVATRDVCFGPKADMGATSSAVNRRFAGMVKPSAFFTCNEGHPLL